MSHIICNFPPGWNNHRCVISQEALDRNWPLFLQAIGCTIEVVEEVPAGVFWLQDPQAPTFAEVNADWLASPDVQPSSATVSWEPD